MRLQIALVGALSLILGFALAFGTKIFWLGGVILVIGGAYCVWRSWQLSGWWRTLIILAIFSVAFAVSHPLGEIIGSWPSAIGFAVVAGVLCWLMSLPSEKSRS